MMVINKNDLRGFDLNLLPVFLTLVQERSLTRAARALNIGQPAASAALKRLREALKDELFVRTPAGMQPTSRASELARVLQPLLSDILGALQTRRPFDPAREARVFRLGMLGNHEYFLMPRLLKRLQKTAPGIRLVVQPILKHAASRMLDDGDIDVACGRIREISKWQSSIPLFEVGYKCLFDGKRLKMKAPISMKKFLDMPHLLLSPNGELEGVVDQALAANNKHRRVIYATSFFSALPALLKQIDAIITLPEYTAMQFAEEYDLTISPTPIAIPKYLTSLVWQTQVTGDPAHAWLRKQIQDVISEIGKRTQKQ
jgi:LysR family transcriptional regulator, mexEF-oprN operon transcriptional activator